MNRRTTATTLLILVATCAASAQISVDVSDYEGMIGAHVSSTIHLLDQTQFAMLTSIIEADGSDQTWDFTSFDYPTRMEDVYEIAPSIAGTPATEFPHFSVANFVRTSTTGGPYGGTTYSPFSLRNDALALLGNVVVQSTDYDANGQLDTSRTLLVPSDVTPLPLAMGRTWTNIFNGTTVGIGEPSAFTITEEATVDGWGTLILPSGSVPALRIRRVRTTQTEGVSTITNVFLEFRTKSLSFASIVHDTNDVVVAASYVDGTVTTGVDEPVAVRSGLRGSAPNPSAGPTRIGFTLASPGHAVLIVSDLFGREVARPVDGHLDAGDHVARFEAGALPDGVYIYRLVVDDEISSRRLVVQN